MNAPARSAHINAHTQSAAHSALERRLRQQLRGAVMFDRASRGRYATDASIYQIEPVGVVVPVDEADA
jgi:FAD/FMN-containing dehydrogenase